MTDRIPCLSSGPKVHAPARYDEDAQNFYKWNLFIIRRSLHCLRFAYFLNSAHRSLKYAIRFLLIQTPPNPLQTLENWSSSARWIRSSFTLTLENKFQSRVARLDE
jgi:hypothetical protein